MKLPTFLFGMIASFGLAWLFLIVIPVKKMSSMPPVKMSDAEDAPFYQRKVSGSQIAGARIYAANGCYTCHTQLIRPTYLGKEIWRSQTGGVLSAYGDSSRETHYDDFKGEKYAQIGLKRIGPDLSNFGHRAGLYAKKLGISPEQWVLHHLYKPRSNKLRLDFKGNPIDMSWSVCPPQTQMFAKNKIIGQAHKYTIELNEEKNTSITPKREAHLLTNYLLSLKRDSTLPDSQNYAAKSKVDENEETTHSEEK